MTANPPGVLDSSELVVKAIKQVVEGNASVLIAEFNETVANSGPKIIRAAIFGSLFALGVLAFFAFVVIGLGDLLEGRYWLSSLLCAGLCLFVGGPVFYSSLKGISDDFQFERTFRSARRTIETLDDKVGDFNETSQGAADGPLTT